MDPDPTLSRRERPLDENEDPATRRDDPAAYEDPASRREDTAAYEDPATRTDEPGAYGEPGTRSDAPMGSGEPAGTETGDVRRDPDERDQGPLDEVKRKAQELLDKVAGPDVPRDTTDEPRTP